MHELCGGNLCRSFSSLSVCDYWDGRLANCEMYFFLNFSNECLLGMQVTTLTPLELPVAVQTPVALEHMPLLDPRHALHVLLENMETLSRSPFA